MVVRCDNCQARYRIDDARVGPNGLTLRCGKCRHLFPAAAEARGGPRRLDGPRPDGALPGCGPTPVAAAAPPRSAHGQATAPRAPFAAAAHPPSAAGDVPTAAPAPGAASTPGAAPAAGSPETASGRPRRGPGHPGRIVGLAAALAALLVALAAFVASKKGDEGTPAEAAAHALAQARALADQDAIALFPQAREAVRAALASAPRPFFGEAHALAAEIEIAWADALEDRKDQLRAKAHLEAALDEAEEGVRANPVSPDVAVALADYHRAIRARSEMDRELDRAASLRADPGRVALVQGLALGQGGALNPGAEDAGRAADLLRRAAEALPRSARVHYRLAQALAAQHKVEEAMVELKETIRLSPSHERARAQLETMASPRRRTDP